MRPSREPVRQIGQTYFITSNACGRKPFFRHARWAELFVKTFYRYRPERFLIHGFVIMPDHFHMLITPWETLERSAQCIKGGFSFRARKELGWSGDVWVAGFSDHRIRDEEDFGVHQGYIARNPVKAGLVERVEDYAYSSASGRFTLDAIPPGLKPRNVEERNGAAKAAPFQSKEAEAKAARFGSKGDEAAPFRSDNGGVEAPPLQDNFQGS